MFAGWPTKHVIPKTCCSFPVRFCFHEQVATPTSTASEGGSEEAAPPLAAPHPSKTQLAALVASGQALAGKLDVFDHNPKEGVVVVGAGGGGGGGGALEEWTDDGGRTKVRTGVCCSGGHRGVCSSRGRYHLRYSRTLVEYLLYLVGMVCS